MVNPDADTKNSSSSSGSAAVQRNIPESCHKHTVERSRSVGI
jgi:hypothetical protein